ncbi:putative holin-like toxin [Alkalihalobacillus sp. BA299]|nr:putative holin-like toxin [Alkalihalobacillus sp. BA299]
MVTYEAMNLVFQFGTFIVPLFVAIIALVANKKKK